jgi:hypothetical protein
VERERNLRVRVARLRTALSRSASARVGILALSPNNRMSAGAWIIGS